VDNPPENHADVLHESTNEPPATRQAQSPPGPSAAFGLIHPSVDAFADRNPQPANKPESPSLSNRLGKARPVDAHVDRISSP
jgi:hypothetical protein